MNVSQGRKKELGTDEWKLRMNVQDEIWEPKERRGKEESKNRKDFEEQECERTDTVSV